MTKRAVLVHAGWAGVALVAFAFGSMRHREGMKEGAGSASSLQEGRPSSRSLRDGGSGAGAGGMRRSGARGGSEGESSVGSGLMSEAQLETLAHEAFKSGSPLARRDAFGRLLEALTPENATTIREFLTSNKADKEQWRDFHYAWGMIDGETALKHGMETKEYDMSYTMSGWASAYPDQARQFLANLPEDVKTDRELLKRSLVAGVADRDPMLAADLVYSMASQGEQRAAEYMSEVAGEVMRTMDATEAALWSQGLPDGDLKGAAMDRVAHHYVEQDPQAAAAWAERFAGESYAGRVIEEVGDEWAKRDPAAAVNWLETLPEGGGQSSGLTSAYGRWAYHDAVAAGERLAAMPRSEQRDAAISGYVNGLSYRDPASAIDWANSIAQDNLRNRALTRAGQALFRRDQEAARAWVVNSGLPPEAQKQVLNPPRR